MNKKDMSGDKEEDISSEEEDISSEEEDISSEEEDISFEEEDISFEEEEVKFKDYVNTTMTKNFKEFFSVNNYFDDNKLIIENDVFLNLTKNVDDKEIHLYHTCPLLESIIKFTTWGVDPANRPGLQMLFEKPTIELVVLSGWFEFYLEVRHDWRVNRAKYLNKHEEKALKVYTIKFLESIEEKIISYMGIVFSTNSTEIWSQMTHSSFGHGSGDPADADNLKLGLESEGLKREKNILLLSIEATNTSIARIASDGAKDFLRQDVKEKKYGQKSTLPPTKQTITVLSEVQGVPFVEKLSAKDSKSENASDYLLQEIENVLDYNPKFKDLPPIQINQTQEYIYTVDPGGVEIVLEELLESIRDKKYPAIKPPPKVERKMGWQNTHTHAKRKNLDDKLRHLDVSVIFTYNKNFIVVVGTKWDKHGGAGGGGRGGGEGEGGTGAGGRADGKVHYYTIIYNKNFKPIYIKYTENKNNFSTIPRILKSVSDDLQAPHPSPLDEISGGWGLTNTDLINISHMKYAVLKYRDDLEGRIATCELGKEENDPSEITFGNCSLVTGDTQNAGLALNTMIIRFEHSDDTYKRMHKDYIGIRGLIVANSKRNNFKIGKKIYNYINNIWVLIRTGGGDPKQTLINNLNGFYYAMNLDEIEQLLTTFELEIEKLENEAAGKLTINDLKIKAKELIVSLDTNIYKQIKRQKKGMNILKKIYREQYKEGGPLAKVYIGECHFSDETLNEVETHVKQVLDSLKPYEIITPQVKEQSDKSKRAVTQIKNLVNWGESRIINSLKDNIVSNFEEIYNIVQKYNKSVTGRVNSIKKKIKEDQSVELLCELGLEDLPPSTPPSKRMKLPETRYDMMADQFVETNSKGEDEEMNEEGGEGEEKEGDEDKKMEEGGGGGEEEEGGEGEEKEGDEDKKMEEAGGNNKRKRDGGKKRKQKRKTKKKLHKKTKRKRSLQKQSSKNKKNKKTTLKRKRFFRKKKRSIRKNKANKQTK
jgi:hypothetical protein